MLQLEFDKDKCAKCKSVACLTKCQYISIGSDAAKIEWQKVINGEESFILKDCTTCYACEEYCPHGNHPFYMIVDRQEERGYCLLQGQSSPCGATRPSRSANLW